MKVAIAIAFSMFAYAQDRPRLGVMLDTTGAARPVYGVPGSVTVGDSSATGVLSSACSRQLCLLKTDSSIVSSTQSVSAPPGPALFALDGDAALVYFPQSNQLARWHHGQLDRVDCDIEGEILSIRVVQGTIEFAVRNQTGTWIVRRGNQVLDSLPDATGDVMLLKSGVLFATAEGLAVRRPDGAWVRLVVEGAGKFVALGEGYVQVRANGSTYGVRVDPGRERLFLLPEPQP